MDTPHKRNASFSVNERLLLLAVRTGAQMIVPALAVTAFCTSVAILLILDSPKGEPVRSDAAGVLSVIMRILIVLWVVMTAVATYVRRDDDECPTAFAANGDGTFRRTRFRYDAETRAWIEVPLAVGVPATLSASTIAKMRWCKRKR